MKILSIEIIEQKGLSIKKKLNKAIVIRLQHVKSHPESGLKTDFGKHRMSSLKHYSIFYVLEEKTIFVTAFWDNRQDRKKLLKRLKNS